MPKRNDINGAGMKDWHQRAILRSSLRSTDACTSVSDMCSLPSMADRPTDEADQIAPEHGRDLITLKLAGCDMEQLDPQGKYPETALTLRVRQVTFQGIGINAYEFTREDGCELPPFTAGAHIDLYFRDGRVRQYSLCNDPAERHHYVVAVLRDDKGRGGSVAIHERVHVQRLVAVGYPRNNFSLIDGAERYLLLAGGIGVTPLKAMVHRLDRIKAEYTLHYCAKGLEFAAFRDEFAPLVASGRVVMHFDGGNPASGLDITDLLRNYEEGTHLYYCGPPGFMAACARGTEHWPAGVVHFEYFSAAASPKSAMSREEIVETGDNALALGFQIKIASSGAIFTVANDKTIAQVLAEHDIEIATSCMAGLCGSCKVRYLSGEVDHRDLILSDSARTECLTTCVSRATSPMLVLDL